MNTWPRVGVGWITLLLVASLPGGSAVAGPNCVKNPDHPKCGGGSPPPPPPSGDANPMIVYADDGILLANADGSNQVQVLPEGFPANFVHLDAPGKRILYWGDIIDNGDLHVMTYDDTDGVISPGNPDVLVQSSDFGVDGGMSGFGLNDWSQGGDQYAYSYYFDGTVYANSVYRIMVAPIDVDGVRNATLPFGQHIVAWEGEPGGGQGQAAWDASGRFLYYMDDFDPNLPHGLFVIDVTGTRGQNIASVDLTPFVVASGFAADSNFQSASAGSLIGATAPVPGGYSFAGDPNARHDDTSLCLMVPFIDWSTTKNESFTIVFDLPALFDPTSTVRCPYATGPGEPIPDFLGEDFTDSDFGIIGMDRNKKNSRGISIADLTSAAGTKTRIIDSGNRADWSN